jgi:glutamine amidotransferase-like uncharacterized protein
VIGKCGNVCLESYLTNATRMKNVYASHWKLQSSIFSLLCLIAIVITGCTSQSDSNPPILLFNGAGTSINDVRAIESLLKAKHLEYSLVGSSRLNSMSETQFAAHRLIIIPGGNFIAMGNGLTRDATLRVHKAIEAGLNYLGICAGAFLAGDGHAYYNSLRLTSGVQFGFYSAENNGIRKAAVAISRVNASTLEHYWEDGPNLAGWGEVVGKYPDGTAAITEGFLGKGWIVLSGVHPEAPESWRYGMTFTTSATADNEYAGELIDAALNRTALPHF